MRASVLQKRTSTANGSGNRLVFKYRVYVHRVQFKPAYYHINTTWTFNLRARESCSLLFPPISLSKFFFYLSFHRYLFISFRIFQPGYAGTALRVTKVIIVITVSFRKFCWLYNREILCAISLYNLL